MIFFIFLLGLCVGSFVNMLVYRYAVKNRLESHACRQAGPKSPKSYKVKNQNRSFCDYCGRQLRWYENIPVISWLFLGGRSNCCRKKLPILYPIVELGMAVLMVMTYAKTGSWLGVLLIAVMVFSCVVDLKYMILPDVATLILIVLSVLMLIGRWPASPRLEFLSALGATGFLGILYLVTKGKGMGFGDVKLAVFMGLLLGFPRIIVAFYIAFIVGAVVGVYLLLSKKVSRLDPIPFGPYLFLGTLAAWWYGQRIWYIVLGR